MSPFTIGLLWNLGIEPERITAATFTLTPGEVPRIQIGIRIPGPSRCTWHHSFRFDHPTDPLHMDALCCMAEIAVLATVNAAAERHIDEMQEAATAASALRAGKDTKNG